MYKIKRLLIIIVVITLTLTAFALIACDKQYTVTYDANGGSFDGGEIVHQHVSRGKINAPTAPVRKGYSFVGWATTKDGGDMWTFDVDEVTKDVTLYAQWSQANVDIAVEGATVEDNDIKMYVDKDVESVNLVSKVRCGDGYSWKLYVDEFGIFELAAKVAPVDDGDNVYYIVVFDVNGNTVDTYMLTIYRHHNVFIRYYDGTVLLHTDTSLTGEQYVANYTPTISGYTFNGWVDSNGNAFSSDTLWKSISLFVQKSANSYTVTLSVNGGEDLSKTEYEVTYGSAFTLPIPMRDGYSFTGWYYDDAQITDENGQSKNVWNVAQSTELTARWQANSYNVTLNVNDANAGNVFGDGEHDYDSSVTVSATTNVGYTWVGWFNGDEKLTDSLSYTFTMSFDNTLTAKWSKVTLELNKIHAGVVTELTGTYAVGDKVTVTADTNAGYTWVGWYNQEGKLTDLQSYVITMTDTDVTYTARWSKSSVVYDSASGAVSGLDGKYKVGDKATLSATTYIGYDFLGWFEEESQLSSALNCTVTLTESDVTYTAKWQVKEEMRLFTFTSTTDSCTLTGVNDKTVTEITVPDCVTAINEGAFSGCGKLQSLTLTFVGAYKSYAPGDYLYPLGYIFGTRYYNGSSYTTQYYRTAQGEAQQYKEYYIPDSLTTVTVVDGNIPFCAFFNCKYVEKVNVPADLTGIGDSAFANCTSLTAITLPHGLAEIGESAFSGSGLQRLRIPSSVKVIGNNAFFDVGSLSEVIFESNSKLVEIGNEAFKLTDIANVALPDGLKVIGSRAFEESSLTAIELPGSLQRIGDFCFSKCNGLQSVVVPENIAYVGVQPFYSCENLTTATWNVKQCEYTVGGIFNHCVNLTTVTFGEEVTQIPDAMFVSCEKLTGLTLPSSVVTIGINAFYKCFALDSITVPSGVRTIDRSAFSNSGLITVTIDDGVEEIGASAFYNCDSLSSVALPDSVTTLGSSAFAYCEQLTEVILPAHLTSIPQYCFNESGLLSIEIPADVVTISEYAFWNCSGLTTLTFANGSKLNNVRERAFMSARIQSLHLPDSVETVGATAFFGNGLEELVIPSGVKSIGVGAFEGNSKLKTVDWYPTLCKLSGSIFSGCGKFSVIFHGQTEIPAYLFAGSSLTDYTIPQGITSIGEAAFADCSSLFEITLPDNLIRIGNNAFKSSGLYKIYWNAAELKESYPAFNTCANLTKVIFGDTVKYIPRWIFYNCRSIKEVYLSNSVETIGTHAFYCCTGLTEIIIPASVKSIEGFAFADCSNLTSVTFENASGWTAWAPNLAKDDRAFSDAELSVKALAAQHLTGTYSEHDWTRSDD